MKRILVACGTALATSAVIALKLEQELGSRGIEVKTSRCKAKDVAAQSRDHDLIVTTTFVSGTGDVPVVQTVSVLTGVGVERDIEAIVEHLTR